MYMPEIVMYTLIAAFNLLYVHTSSMLNAQYH